MRTLQLTDEQKAMHSIEPGPHWDDGCEHGLHQYVCTFTCLRQWEQAGKTVHKLEHYDLYVFDNKFYGVEVCLRYGKEGNEYISPGGLMEFLNTAGHNWREMPHYERASRILREYGVVTWEARPPK